MKFTLERYMNEGNNHQKNEDIKKAKTAIPKLIMKRVLRSEKLL